MFVGRGGNASRKRPPGRGRQVGSGRKTGRQKLAGRDWQPEAGR